MFLPGKVTQTAGRRVVLVAVNQLLALFRNLASVPFAYAAWKLHAALLMPPIDGVEATTYEPDTVDPEAIAEHILSLAPDVVGFSTYLWSFTPFVEATRIIKRARPEVTVLFGGPSARPAMFDLPEFRPYRHLVDAVCVNEGETTIREIVQATDRSPGALRRIPGLMVLDGDAWVATPPRELPPLDSLFSPHQLGIVASGLGANLETFRGCPLSCAFCEWGVLGTSGRIWSEEYLVRELDALRRARSTNIYLIDAGLNLNRKAFRNLVAAEKAVGFMRTVPVGMEIYATAVNEADVEFLKSILVGRIGVGLQSFNPEVNRHLQRPYDEKRFLRGIDLLSAVPNTAVEIILGLPYDNPASFRETVRRAMELDATAVHVFHSLVLPDGLMTRAPAGSDLRFDPHTLKTISAHGWSERDLAETGEWLRRQCDELGGTYDTTMWRLPARGMHRERPLAMPSPEQVVTVRGPDALVTRDEHFASMNSPFLAPDRRRPQPMNVPLALEEQHALGEAIIAVSKQTWKLVDAAFRAPGVITVDCWFRDGAFQFVLLLAPREAQCFRWVDGVAVSHTTAADTFSPADVDALDALARTMAVALRPVLEAAVRPSSDPGSLAPAASTPAVRRLPVLNPPTD